MKIAFVSTILGYGWGGADVLWTRAAAAALAAGHRVLLAVNPDVAAHARIKAMGDAGAKILPRTAFTQHSGRREKWRQSIARRMGAAHSLTGALDAFGPDHVVISQGGTFDFLIEDGLMDWLDETRTLFTLVAQSNDEREALSPVDQQTTRKVFCRARATVFVSSHNWRHAQRQCGAEIPRAAFVPNPIEITSDPALPWPVGREPRLAVVARLEIATKGFDLLLEALAALASQPWTMCVFGRGPDDDAIRQRSASLGLDQRILFRGYATDVRQVWSDHHLLVLPSRREGCSLAMLEALACGRPVLMTGVGGASDWIRPRETGYVCAPNNVAALTHTLRCALAEFARWSEMGAAARADLLQRHPFSTESRLLALVTAAPAGDAFAGSVSAKASLQ